MLWDIFGTNMNSSVLRFEDVAKSFNQVPVFAGISFNVAAGAVHFVLGPSGAGKSVLIKQVVGLLKPDHGRIFVRNEDVTRLSEDKLMAVRRRCQLIFQNATLFDSATVLENVAMPIAKRFAIAKSAAQERAYSALEQVHAAHLAGRLPAELGVGVRKRVAIARALALEPEILLYDEPTTGLDPVAARRTDRLIREMADRFGITSLVVSHDLQSVRSIADRVTFIANGKILFDGAVDALFCTTDTYLHSFCHAATCVANLSHVSGNH